MKKYIKYIVYFIGLFLVALGASLSIKANLGTTPLVCIPYVADLITNLSVGTTTFIFNIILIAIQVIILRKGFEKRQLLQIVVGTIFAECIDDTLILVNFLDPVNYASQFILLLISCVVMAMGVLLETKANVVYLPGDGLIVALSKVFNKEFGEMKPYCDVPMVIIAAIASFIFLGHLGGVREGTVVSAIIIGPIVAVLNEYLGSYIDRIV